MLTNKLDLSLLRCSIKFKYNEHKLCFTKYTLVHNWDPEDVDLVFYTEQELRQIKWSFGHPEIRTKLNLFKMAKVTRPDKATEHLIKGITEFCQICKENVGPPG